MSANEATNGDDKAPGVERDGGDWRRYLIGFVLAVLLTLSSFWAAQTHMVWAPSVPVLLGVLAIAQMGVHLVFFFHISSAPDQTNNFLALAFGLLVVGRVVFGSLWIMTNLNANMMPMGRLMLLER